VALDSLDLHIEPQRVLDAFRSSGCGAHNIIAGFEKPDGGTVFYADRLRGGIAAWYFRTMRCSLAERAADIEYSLREKGLATAIKVIPALR
jgi:ABC-type taurine transport system ATPase subunit